MDDVSSESESSGTPVSERSRRDSRCGWMVWATSRWITTMATSLAGISRSSIATIWIVVEPCPART